MNSPPWKAGAASVAITPTEPMWLAGWAARRAPASGKGMELYAKAAAFEDAKGARLVIVTADLIAIPRELANEVAERVAKSRQIPRERLLFNASHTHTAPEVRPDKVPFFEIPAEFAAKIAPYVAQLAERLTSLIEAALDGLQAVTLRVHHVHAEFATNRRSPDGPVDRTVPVLVVTGVAGKPVALLFGYACHNLTLPPSSCEYHGDYAGVAQALLEETFPGARALFVAGAGADQDPAPRGTLELARVHGRELFERIRGGVAGPGSCVSGGLHVAFEEVTLDLLPVPSPAQLQLDTQSEDAPRRRKAHFLLTALGEKRTLAKTQQCPVQVIQFGTELLLIALGGEPVAEYAHRFKREHGGHGFVWVAGYSNDMFGYLPTRSVQAEGGYEGGRAAFWSALPAPVDETTEQRIVEAVGRGVRAVRSAPA